MTNPQQGSRASFDLARDGAHPVVPLVISVIVVLVAWVVELAAPSGLSRLAPLAASLAIGVAYLVRPKPTLLAFAMVALFMRSLDRWFAPDMPFVDNFAVPVLLVLAALRIKPWRRGFFRPVRDIALATALGAGALSALVAGVPFSVWIVGTLIIAKLIAFLYIVEWHDFSARDLRQFVPFVLGTAFVVLAVGAVEALNPDYVRQVLNLGGLGTERQGLPSIQSLLTHPGVFAWFCSFVALFLYAGYVVYRRWWLMIAGGAFTVAMLLSARRRAVVSLAVALIGGVAASIRSRSGLRESLSPWLPTAVAVAVVAVAFGPALGRMVNETVSELTDPGTARVALYSASVEIARDHFPLGVGFGRFGSAPSKDPYSPIYAEYGLDNVHGLTAENPSFIKDAFWARMLGEAGIIGMLSLLVFLGAVAVALWRAARLAYSDRLATAFTLGAWMILVQGLTDTLTSVGLDSPPRMYLFFGAVGVALSLGRNLGDRPDPEPD